MAAPRTARDRLTAGTAPNQITGSPVRFVEILALLGGASLVAVVVSSSEISWVLLAAGAMVLFLVTFLSPDTGLYILIMSMLLSPEFIVGNLAGQTAQGRGVTLRLEDFLIILIGVAWLAHTAVNKDTPLLRASPLNLPIFTYLLVCAVSTALGVIAGRVVLTTGILFVFKYFEFVVIYFMVVNYARDRDRIRRLLYLALITAAIIAVIAILQIPSGNRVTAPFEGGVGEPNTLGGYLVLLLAITLGLLSSREEPSRRHLWGGLALLLLVPIAYTLSRTSWLALAAMLLTVVLLSRRKMLFLILALGGMIFLLIVAPDQIIERLHFTVSGQAAYRGTIEVFGIMIEPSAAARIMAWIDVSRDIVSHPLLGHGVTGYRFLDAQYPRTILETGLLGFAALLWIMWQTFRVGLENYRRGDSQLESALGLGLVAGLVGLAVHGIGANTFIIVRIMEPFWLLVGLAVALNMLPEESTTSESPQAAESRDLLRGSGSSAIMAEPMQATSQGGSVPGS
jgi:hypothetical protein